MPKTKITLEEIEYMLRFGREMAKRMETLGIQPTAVSRLTDGRVSSSYISDIRRAALGLSRRFSRLGGFAQSVRLAQTGSELHKAIIG
jgi:hypothetical protein